MCTGTVVHGHRRGHCGTQSSFIGLTLADVGEVGGSIIDLTLTVELNIRADLAHVGEQRRGSVLAEGSLRSSTRTVVECAAQLTGHLQKGWSYRRAEEEEDEEREHNVGRVPALNNPPAASSAAPRVSNQLSTARCPPSAHGRAYIARHVTGCHPTRNEGSECGRRRGEQCLPGPTSVARSRTR